jgi:hypothetical protein
MSIGFPALADAVTAYAFYALVAGVALQIVCYSRNRKYDGENG